MGVKEERRSIRPEVSVVLEGFSTENFETTKRTPSMLINCYESNHEFQ